MTELKTKSNEEIGVLRKSCTKLSKRKFGFHWGARMHLGWESILALYLQAEARENVM